MNDKYLLCRNRIPKSFFITKGTGESDLENHAGSYHIALKNAGIEVCNIMTYSSILPDIAKRIEKPKSFQHGEVMKSIISEMSGKKGEHISSGIIYGWLKSKLNPYKKYRGLVCEIKGNYSIEKLKEKLQASLTELYTCVTDNSLAFSDDYDLVNIEIITNELQITKEHGTCLTALCFCNYIIPIIRVNNLDFKTNLYE